MGYGGGTSSGGKKKLSKSYKGMRGQTNTSRMTRTKSVSTTRRKGK